MKQQYLITTTDGQGPYYTDWYTHDNCFDSEAGMVVYDLVNHEYTDNGETWKPIEFDHL